MDILSELPIELSEHILQYLDVCSLCTAQQVSLEWRHIINCSSRVWRKMCARFCVQQDIERDRTAGYSWRDVLQKNYKKKEICEKWLLGEFSEPKVYEDLPLRHMWPMDAESWGDILDRELSR